MPTYKVRINYRTLDREKNEYVSKSETYVHTAVTISEAEFQIKREMAVRLKDFKVKSINEFAVSDTALHHIFHSDQQDEADPWYLCKVDYDTFKEKILITATSVIEAHQRLEKHLKKSQIPFTIKDVDSTTILAVFDPDNDSLTLDYRNRVEWMDLQEIKKAEPVRKKDKYPGQQRLFDEGADAIDKENPDAPFG